MRKGYIALFTYGTTRAVHLELCTDMSTDKFFGSPTIREETRTATHRLNGQRSDLSCHQQTPSSTMVLSICSQNLTNSSLITIFVGGLLLRGQLGGEDGGSGRS